MKIKKRRIRNVWNHLSLFKDDEKFYVSLKELEKHKDKLKEIGFNNLAVGEKLLPLAVGPVSTYNAEGRYNIFKDQPKETVYKYVYREWKAWGRNETYSGYYDMPYERYPREFVEPPSVELTIVGTDEGKLLISDVIVKTKDNEDRIKHLINLFLELFGECELLDEGLAPPIPIKTINLNWEILPQGRYPWDKVKGIVNDMIQKRSESEQKVIRKCIKTITSYEPEFVAVGKGGFSNYQIYGFPEKNLYLLESTIEGNATYVFRENWEDLSKLTKREILSNELHEDRIIHSEGWESRVRSLLDKKYF